VAATSDTLISLFRPSDDDMDNSEQDAADTIIKKYTYAGKWLMRGIDPFIMVSFMMEVGSKASSEDAEYVYHHDISIMYYFDGSLTTVVWKRYQQPQQVQKDQGLQLTNGDCSWLPRYRKRVWGYSIRRELAKVFVSGNIRVLSDLSSKLVNCIITPA
jgi:hypothetical protein